MEKVYDFLKKNNVCTLATSSEGNPRASIVEYYMLGNAIIFATSPDSIKAQNLRKNNRISMSVWEMPMFVTLDGTTTSPAEEEIASYNKQLFVRHPEFVEMINNKLMPPFQYYKLVIETAYFNDYSQGMVPVQIFKIG